MKVGYQGGQRRERLWIYAVLPAVLLNLAACAIFGAYYGLAAQRPELVAAIGQGQVFFALRENMNHPREDLL